MKSSPPSHQKHALAGGLAVEQAVGGFGLVEAPAVGEQRVHVDPAVGDEAGAVGLADGREGPGANQRHLPAQQIVADIESHLAALADEAGLAPGAQAFHRLRAGQRR